LDVREGEIICQTISYLIPTVDLVIEVVANLLRIRETTFIPGRIDRCPECDSDKIASPKKPGLEEEERIGRHQLALFELWLHGRREERRKQPVSV
jgi:hypothetical protein